MTSPEPSFAAGHWCAGLGASPANSEIVVLGELILPLRIALGPAGLLHGY